MHLNDERTKNIALISGVAVLTVILMFFFRYNREEFGGLVEKGQRSIAELYAKNLKPLFVDEKLSQKDVFNFAVSGSLPLDGESKYLNVGNTREGKAFYEIKNNDKAAPDYYTMFVKSHNLTEDEIEKMDSVLSEYKDDLYASVLENERNVYAVNQGLYVLMASIRMDLERLLSNFEINYIGSDENSGYNSDSLRVVLQKLRANSIDNYLVIAPDTILSLVADMSGFLKKNGEEGKNTTEDFGNELTNIIENTNFSIDSDSSNSFVYNFQTDSGAVKILFNRPAGGISNLLNLEVNDSGKVVSVLFNIDTTNGSIGLNVTKRDDDTLTNVAVEFNVDNLTKLIGSSISLMAKKRSKPESELEAQLDSLMRLYNIVRIDSLKSDVKVGKQKSGKTPKRDN